MSAPVLSASTPAVIQPLSLSPTATHPAPPPFLSAAVSFRRHGAPGGGRGASRPRVIVVFSNRTRRINVGPKHVRLLWGRAVCQVPTFLQVTGYTKGCANIPRPSPILSLPNCLKAKRNSNFRYIFANTKVTKMLQKV